MSKNSMIALIALATFAAGVGTASAEALYESGLAFHSMTGANESVVSRDFLNGSIHNVGTSDIFAAASATRTMPVPAGSNQTVVITGFNNTAAGTCTVRSITPTGIQSAAVAQNLPVGNWSLSFTFTSAQAPAGNTFAVYCSLLANAGNRIYGMSVSP